MNKTEFVITSLCSSFFYIYAKASSFKIFFAGLYSPGKVLESAKYNPYGGSYIILFFPLLIVLLQYFFHSIFSKNHFVRVFKWIQLNDTPFWVYRIVKKTIKSTLSVRYYYISAKEI